MLGYKFFFKQNLVYGCLNPSNVIKFENKFKLLVPTSIFPELEKLNEFEEDKELFYQSPELLRGDQITSKSDVWSLGCILYHMLYGKAPWEINFPKKLIQNKNLSRNKMKKYLLLDYIENTPLVFPSSSSNKYQISVWIMDLFKNIFVMNP